MRKLISWLTTRTAAGELFDIDTALRPNGNSGLLVTSIDSFANYQTGRGGNTAWTWEHQALSRARWCAGIERLAPRFEAVRRHVLAAPRDRAALIGEVKAMREKVRAAHPVKDGRFDLKHSPGGMIDVEFAVQALVLAESGAHPELLDNVGNIALLGRAEAAGLLPEGVGSAAADAYRELRRAQHRARLDEQTTQLDPETMAAQRAAVLAPLACRLRLGRRPVDAGQRSIFAAGLLGLGAVAALGLSSLALDWQPARIWREPWRAWSAALVHLSALHLVANLAGCALVGGARRRRPRAASQRHGRLARRLAADAYSRCWRGPT